MKGKPCAPVLLPRTAQPVAGENSYYESFFTAQGCLLVAGLDEAGRGPLAGPVVASCVILPADCEYSLFQDSKILSPKKREQLFSILYELPALIGVAQVDARVIEKINILQASLLAMKKAVDDCAANNYGLYPDQLLVDGNQQAPVTIEQLTLVKGESKSASIAAASIIAKVTRDRIMSQAHEQYPMYNFIKNQGYPTKEHRKAIASYGPCDLHRRSFKGVREFLDHPGHEYHPLQQELW